MYVGDAPLYAVKRENADKWVTGSSSFVSPRIYIRKGDAEKVCRQENMYRERNMKNLADTGAVYKQAESQVRFAKDGDDLPWAGDGPLRDRYVNWYVSSRAQYLQDDIDQGPWVVVEVDLIVKKVYK